MNNTRVYFRAIHLKVLIVYVVFPNPSPPKDGPRGTWRCFVLPVAGKDHRKEAAAWRDEGIALRECEARALWPATVADFEAGGLKWWP